MKIAIAKAYNGIHKNFNKHLKSIGVDTLYFDIDKPEWYKINNKKPDAYIWLADQKEEHYREIHDKIYFIEKILNKPVFPNMNMFFAEGDKKKQYYILDYLKIKMPNTFITHKKEQALNFIKKTNYPFILKDPYGYGGIHVFKIKNQNEAKKYIEKIFDKGLQTKFSLCKNIFYGQEFIKAEKDLRVITINKKAVCAYWRKNENNKWKHNLEQGGKVYFNNIPQKALLLCEKISKKMNFHWMGYDLLMKNDKPLLLEYSACIRTKGAEQGKYDIRKLQSIYIYNYLNNKKNYEGKKK